MSELPEVKVIARLMELADRYGLEELSVEEDGLKVRLSAAPPPSVDEADDEGGTRYLWNPPSWSSPSLPPAQPARSETAHAIVAPLTGTFYRASAPDAPNFTEVGATVEEGQVLCLIEAMKVFSEVTADRAGTVTEIVVQNGRLVERGEVLLYIEPA